MLRRAVSGVMMIGLLILACALAILEKYTLTHMHYTLKNYGELFSQASAESPFAARFAVSPSLVEGV